MGFFTRLTTKLGITKSHGERHPIRIFLLEDDERRCEWFRKRFKGDQLDTLSDDPSVLQQQLLALSGDDPSSPSQIYVDGLATGNSSFELDAPTWEHWDAAHHRHSRLVAHGEGDLRAGAGERASGLDADAGRPTGDDDPVAGQVDSGHHLCGGRFESERGRDQCHGHIFPTP